MSAPHIPFNSVRPTGKEFEYIAEVLRTGKLAGDGPFTHRCHDWLVRSTGTRKALLTHSCTAALEMAALLADVGPGDEVIMPSYTFVSTANAFVLRGAVPVFIDVREDTLNLDERRIEAALTSRTKVIVPVHYAGVACEMDEIMALAEEHQLLVVEDAAQGVMARYKGRALGSIGHLGALSFHETKNLVSGEGGALLVNSAEFVERAEVIREKGTDRSRFYRGEIEKYTWQDIGSSFLPSELIAAHLWAKLEQATTVTDRRMHVWEYYHTAFASLEAEGLARRPVVPVGCEHNAAMYYLLTPSPASRADTLASLREAGIGAVFHYVPLHGSPAGRRLARQSGQLSITESISARLVRLPLWPGLTDEELMRVVEVVTAALRR